MVLDFNVTLKENKEQSYEHDRIIHEQLNLEIIEEEAKSYTVRKTHYLAHRPVWNYENVHSVWCKLQK